VINHPSWPNVHALLDAALARDDRHRAEFLDEACGGDSALRAEVASLLDAYQKSGGFTETPVFRASPELLADPVEPLEGKTIGPYLIREEIGRGDMGVVFLAEDTRSSRRVALKALTLNAGTDVDRLREEAQAAAALTHPGIATVYALENIGGRLFVAHEYVAGQTLRALLESGPLAMRQVLDIATQLARALAAAHAQGVVHRDLKPENAVRTPAGAVKSSILVSRASNRRLATV
jgi:eukaryotic-like serine/threonine-protein kinase